MADALFEVDGDRVRPTGFSRGPWSPDALHGGPVAALITRAVEAVPADQPMLMARLTVELMRPVPLDDLVLRTSVVRPGRKVQLIETTITAGGIEVVRAVALRVRVAELGSAHTGWDHHGWPDPDSVAQEERLARTRHGMVAYHSHGVDMRFVKGQFNDRGPSTVWMRLLVPVVEGEEPSPLQRVAAVADFGNGISNVLPWEQWLFINPDLTIGLSRPPQGDWIGLDAVTRISQVGVGQAESLLFDRLGTIGRATQSLLIDRVSR